MSPDFRTVVSVWDQVPARPPSHPQPRTKLLPPQVCYDKSSTVHTDRLTKYPLLYVWWAGVRARPAPVARRVRGRGTGDRPTALLRSVVAALAPPV
jgi:hypothetical protein